MFKFSSGPVKPYHLAKKASTAFAQGIAAEFDSGYVDVGTTTSTKIAGLVNQVVDTTTVDFVGNPNYALTSDIEIILPLEETIFEADVTGGTIAQANIGTQYDTASDGLSVNVGATTNKNWTLVEVISTTKGLFKCATPFWLK